MDRAKSALSKNDIILDPSPTQQGDYKMGSDELQHLRQYFENSRMELEKKINSLVAFSLDLDRPRENILTDFKSRRANLSQTKADAFSGTPITLQIAIELRKATIGNAVHSFSSDWRRAKFHFRDENSEMAYGLIADRNSSKGLVMTVQAKMMKNFLLNGYRDINGDEIKDSKWRNERRIFKPTDYEKKVILIKTLTEILWKAGNSQSAVVCLNSLNNQFERPEIALGKVSEYFFDGLTERLKLYEFKTHDALETFIRRNLETFQREDGVILFLYSVILSKSFEKLYTELQGSLLIDDTETCTIALHNLILAGVATPFVHNHTVEFDAKGYQLPRAQEGIKTRNDIGIFYWDHKEDDKNRTEVGSMLKTPKYPIWLVVMNKMVAVLFNTNIELVNDWRLEQYFKLHFYAGLRKQEKAIVLSIDNRNSYELTSDAPPNKLSRFKFYVQEKEADIIEAINIKWRKCEIDVDGKDLMALLA